MKKLLLMFSLILFIPVLNAEENTYFDLPQISVSELPEASVDTLNIIYIYNNKYYVTISEQSGTTGTRLELNINYGDTTLYSNFTDSDCAYAIENFTTNNVAYAKLALGNNVSNFSNYPWYTSSRQISTGVSGQEILKCNADGTLDFAYFNNGAVWHTSSFQRVFVVNQWYGDIGTWVNNHLSTTSFSGSITYSWEEITEEQVFRVKPEKIFVPSKNLYCYHFVDSNTLRGYIENPVVSSDVDYYDFDINHHYRQSTGIETITDIPVCLANTTTNYLYREDIVEILIYTFLVGFIVIYIPFRIIMSFFKRRF